MRLQRMCHRGGASKARIEDQRLQHLQATASGDVRGQIDARSAAMRVAWGGRLLEKRKAAVRTAKAVKKYMDAHPVQTAQEASAVRLTARNVRGPLPMNTVLRFTDGKMFASI